jgi:hypothetical protein
VCVCFITTLCKGTHPFCAAVVVVSRLTRYCARLVRNVLGDCPNVCVKKKTQISTPTCSPSRLENHFHSRWCQGVAPRGRRGPAGPSSLKHVVLAQISSPRGCPLAGPRACVGAAGCFGWSILRALCMTGINWHAGASLPLGVRGVVQAPFAPCPLRLSYLHVGTGYGLPWQWLHSSTFAGSGHLKFKSFIAQQLVNCSKWNGGITPVRAFVSRAR